MASLMNTLKLVQKLSANNPAVLRQAARSSKFFSHKPDQVEQPTIAAIFCSLRNLLMVVW